jgi:hypothetical protein
VRRWVLLASAALLAAAAGLAWWMTQPPREGVRLHDPSRSFPWARAPMALQSPAEAGGPPAPAAGDPAAVPAPQAASSAPVAIDLCGLGRVTVAAGRAPSPEPLAALPTPVGQYALQEAQGRLVATLAAGDARQRVAARLMQQPAEDEPSVQAAWARGVLADALASNDAQALRWAATACPFVPDDAQCTRRLARARVRAEPANALHWLDWANEEPEAADAAWAGLARAQYWREQPLGLAGVLLRAVPTDIPGYLQSTLAVEAMAHDVAYPSPPLTLVLERCPARRDGAGAAAAGTCERLARLLVERSDSVQALMLGRELGEHVGWSPAQLQRLDEEVESLQRQEARWGGEPARSGGPIGALGCETVEAQRRHIAAVERDGELAALRRGLPPNR